MIEWNICLPWTTASTRSILSSFYVCTGNLKPRPTVVQDKKQTKSRGVVDRTDAFRSQVVIHVAQSILMLT